MDPRVFRAVPNRIVLTGGPGAGKTAVLEIARKELQSDVVILPESASIVFGGGFPRRSDVISRQAAQRAIYHVQSELERLALERHDAPLVLCDRGTLDGLAYWPGPWDDFLRDVGTSLEVELARYAAVVHLRVPELPDYRSSGLRTESVEEAREIDERLLKVWAKHPQRIVIDTDHDFWAKTKRALEMLRQLSMSARRTELGIAREEVRT